MEKNFLKPTQHLPVCLNIVQSTRGCLVDKEPDNLQGGLRPLWLLRSSLFQKLEFTILARNVSVENTSLLPLCVDCHSIHNIILRMLPGPPPCTLLEGFVLQGSNATSKRNIPMFYLRLMPCMMQRRVLSGYIVIATTAHLHVTLDAAGDSSNHKCLWFLCIQMVEADAQFDEQV